MDLTCVQIVSYTFKSNFESTWNFLKGHLNKQHLESPGKIQLPGYESQEHSIEKIIFFKNGSNLAQPQLCLDEAVHSMSMTVNLMLPPPCFLMVMAFIGKALIMSYLKVELELI